ncbi:MAG: hypothetical protein ACRYFS_24360 [Janthinobacterium lividum]
MSLEMALEAVLTQLVRLERPLVSLLQPGLTREAIDEIADPLPFKLPEELYQLYMWRNGIQAGSHEDTVFFAHPASYFAPLDLAVDASTYLSEDLMTNPLRETWEPLEFKPSAYYFDLFSDPGDSDFLVPCATIPLEKPPIVFWSPELGTPRIRYTNLESMMWTIAACYESGAYFLKKDFENEPLHVDVYPTQEWQIAKRLNPTVTYWQEESN